MSSDQSYRVEGMFITETNTEACNWQFRINKFLVEGQTKYQQYQIVDMPVFGKTLFLDYAIQSALMDEHVYHESMAQPAMITHPNPKKALICGGGEGATLWQALQHNTVEEAHMIDLDEELIDMVKVHMEEWHKGAFDDPRTTLEHLDARKWVEDHSGYGYDVIMSDLPNPVPGGPAYYLYTQDYFRHVAKALNEDGVFVLQSGAVNELYPYLFASVLKTLQSLPEIFPVVRGYYGLVSTFQTPWGFILASKKHDPLELSVEEIAQRLEQRGVKNRYVTPRFFHSMFCLPEFMLEEAETNARVLTDGEPFIWRA